MAYEIVELSIKGKPVPKQSTRFTKSGHAYTPKNVTQAKNNIITQAVCQIKGYEWDDFLPFTGEVHILYCTFYFKLPKAAKRSLKDQLRDGTRIFKPSRPDLTDNLMKGLIDALSGIVFKDDSQIVSMTFISKQYTLDEPRVEIKLGGFV